LEQAGERSRPDVIEGKSATTAASDPSFFTVSAWVELGVRALVMIDAKHFHARI
jgi:hypothetical protein